MKFLANGLVLALALSPACAAAMTPAQVFKTASPSVVTIFIVDQAGQDLTQGSGVTVSSGRVITNCHLMKHQGDIRISYQERRYAATLIGEDVDRDLCVLKSPSLPAAPVTLGHSADVEIGAPVYAIGAPQGFDLTLSDGLLSGRRGKGEEQILQFTAPISVGSSGGGLFDDNGNLIGITTLIHKEAQQINFAVPVEWIGDIKPANRVTAVDAGGTALSASSISAEGNAADAAQDAADAAAIAADASAGTPKTRTGQGKVYSYVKDGVRHYRTTPPPAGTTFREINYQYKPDDTDSWIELYRDSRVTVEFKYVSGDLTNGFIGWEKYKRREPMVVPGHREKAAYTMARKRVDCVARSTSIAEYFYYTADGRVITGSADTMFSRSESTVPESVGEAVLDAVCGG